MSKKRPRYYWDADVFINLIQQHPEHYVILQDLIEKAKAGEIEIVTSFLTLSEVIKERSGGVLLPDTDELTLNDLFENDYIQFRVVDRHVASKARDLRRYYGLKLGDAIHVATAILWGVTALHSYDGDDLLNKNVKVGSPPLRIERPRGQVQSKVL